AMNNPVLMNDPTGLYPAWYPDGYGEGGDLEHRLFRDYSEGWSRRGENGSRYGGGSWGGSGGGGRGGGGGGNGAPVVAIGNWVIDCGKLPDGAYLFDINNGQITNFTAYTDADIAGMGLQLFSSIVGANYTPESDYTGGARLWQAGNIFVGLHAQQGGLGELSPNSAYTVRGNDVNWETLYNEFLTGEGPEYSGFGANHPMTKDLKNSWIVGIA